MLAHLVEVKEYCTINSSLHHPEDIVMGVKLHPRDHRTYDTLIGCDRKRGLSPYELAKAAGIPILLLFGVIDRLEDGGFVERRCPGEDWPSGGGYSDKGLSPTEQPDLSLYRCISPHGQTLAALIHSKRF